MNIWFVTLIVILGFAACAYFVIFIATFLSENRWRLRMERHYGYIIWGESLFRTSIKLGLKRKPGYPVDIYPDKLK